jgi:type I restriction enzyme M protein
MQPHIDMAERARAATILHKEKLKALKKKDAKADNIAAIEEKIKEQEKIARDSQSKADAIGAAVFDLKAVNPNVVVRVDTRTTAEVIQNIQDQSNIVAKSLETLRVLLQQ